MFKLWTEEEVTKLKELYPLLRIKQLAPLFPGRNKHTIAVKALSLNLPSAKLWQKEENVLLRKKFALCSKEELLKLFPKRTWAAIMAQGERLGAKRKRNKPRLFVNEAYFNKWSENMAYVLGYILADGCIVKGSKKGYSDSLKFGVQLKDRDILEKIKKEFSSEHSISTIKNAAHLSISSQKLVDSLKRLGITYRKSLKEKVPLIPDKYIKDFIRGLIDGDGGVSFDIRQYPTLGFCGGINTVTFVRDYFWKNFQAFSTIGKREFSHSANSYLYSLTYRSNTAKQLLLHLYTGAGIYLDRKYHLSLKCHNIQIRKKINPLITQYATHSGGESYKI